MAALNEAPTVPEPVGRLQIENVVSVAERVLHSEFRVCVCCDRWTQEGDSRVLVDAAIPAQFFVLLKVPSNSDLPDELLKQYDVSSKFTTEAGAAVCLSHSYCSS